MDESGVVEETVVDFSVGMTDILPMKYELDRRPSCEPGIVSTTTKGPKRKKICLVCGDRAIGCNFGVVSCESCKAFFRRMAFRVIRGRCNGECVVDVESRVYCKSCRLKKCFSVGMRKDMIVNEEKKGRSTSRAESPTPPAHVTVKKESVDCTYGDLITSWTDNDERTLEELRRAFEPMHSPADVSPPTPSTMDIINMADRSVRRLISCVKSLPCFCHLAVASQIELLKYSAIEVLILCSSNQYDANQKKWQSSEESLISLDRIEQEGHSMMTEMMEGYIKFVTNIKPLIRGDINIMNLLITICLLSLEIYLDDGSTAEATLSFHQEDYTFLLQRYTRRHYPEPLLFPKLVMKLSDLKYLKDMHSRLLNSVDVKLVAPLLKEVFNVSK